MAKDDYFVIVYKVLIYLYAVLKRKHVFNEAELIAALKIKDLSEDYFNDVIKMMYDDGLITGLKYTKVWSGEYLLINELSNMKITSKGIEYLTDNSKMQSVKAFLIESADLFSKLFPLVF